MFLILEPVDAYDGDNRWLNRCAENDLEGFETEKEAQQWAEENEYFDCALVKFIRFV